MPLTATSCRPAANRSRDLLDPDAPTGVGEEQRQRFFHCAAVMEAHIGVKEQDLERRIELQERLQKVGLVPRVSATNPLFRLLIGPEYVVKMNDHASLERGQDVREEVHDIAADLRDV